MPQRDDLIEEIKRTDLLLEWAVQNGDEAEAERLREMLRAIREEVDALYVPGTRYRKTGIVFFGLEKPPPWTPSTRASARARYSPPPRGWARGRGT